jgi:hypothetical protein
MRMAWRVSTLRGTRRTAWERRRRDSLKREVIRESRVGEGGRCREAIRQEAVRRRGEWIRRWVRRVGRLGKPIHLPYSWMKLEASVCGMTFCFGGEGHFEEFLGS